MEFTKENFNIVTMEAFLRKVAKDAAKEAVSEFTALSEPLKDYPELLTRQQAAEALQCTPGTIDNLCERGVFARHYIGSRPFIKKTAILCYLQNK